MEWFLVVIILNGSGNGSYKYHNTQGMSLADCQKASKTLNAKVPSGGEAEQGIAVVCTKGKLGKIE